MEVNTARSRHPDSMRQAFLWALIPALVLILIAPSLGDAQVVTHITSSGLGTSVPPPSDGVYNIIGGTRPGDGTGPILFHSFGHFSVGQGDIANFLNNTGVTTTNILGRVTGGNTSNIDGTIQTTGFGDANLFLVNPSGIVFGPHGSVNVGGSVSFSTAQYLRLFDGVNSGNFYTNPASDGLANSVLAVAPVVDFGFLSPVAPVAYGFLTAPAPTATITVQGSNLSIPPTLLDTPPNSISLVGGKVIIEGGAQLSAPNGRIHLATTASPGEFAALPGESLANATSLQAIPSNPVDPASASAFTSYGLVSLAPGSSIDVHGTSTVWIKGGQLLLSVNDATLSTTESSAPSDTVSLSPSSSIVTSNSGTEPGADVQITVGTLQMDGAAIATINNVSASNQGGNITADVGMLSLTGGATTSGATIQTLNFGPQGGDVTIQGVQGGSSAAGSVTLSDLATISTTNLSDSGHGGNVSITANTLTLANSAQVSTDAFTVAGIGGNLSLNVGTLTLKGGDFGGSSIRSSNSSSGDLDVDGVADVFNAAGGNVTIQGVKGVGSAAGSVVFSGGSGIKSETTIVGNGGAVFIAAKQLNLNGTDLDGHPTTIESAMFGIGLGGDIAVSVKDAILTGGATIASRTFLSDAVAGLVPGKGGTITVQGLPELGKDVTKADSFTLAGFHSGIISESFGQGTPGDIVVHAKTVGLNDGAVIEAGNPQNTGTGGNATIDAVSVSIVGGSHIVSQASGLDAGKMIISADQLTLDNGSIATSTVPSTPGRGGNVVIDVGNVNLTNGATINSSTAGTGRAGDITINGGSLMLANHAEITSSSKGTAVDAGNAGNITIQSGSTVVLNNSSITTEAKEASGGQIEINAPEMVQLINSRVSTSVGGLAKVSNGGNITIDPQFVVLQNSQVIAQANAGAGGAIDIIAGSAFIKDPVSIVDASSTKGISGIVNIQSPLQNIGGELTALSQEFSSAAALLAQQCAARAAGGTFSTFVVAAREGLPVEPGGFLASPSLMTELLGSRLSGRDPQTQLSAATGLLPKYDAKPIQLAKLGGACR